MGLYLHCSQALVYFQSPQIWCHTVIIYIFYLFRPIFISHLLKFCCSSQMNQWNLWNLWPELTPQHSSSFYLAVAPMGHRFLQSAPTRQVAWPSRHNTNHIKRIKKGSIINTKLSRTFHYDTFTQPTWSTALVSTPNSFNSKQRICINRCQSHFFRKKTSPRTPVTDFFILLFCPSDMLSL